MSTKTDDLERSMSDYTPEQLSAIRRSIKRGREIQLNIPEVAEDYSLREMSLSEIVRFRGIIETYRDTEEVAITSVFYAIHGHNGLNGTPPYKGLIADPSELERIRFKHWINLGYNMHEQGVGIHARTSEEHSEDGHSGGIISGPINYVNGVGIHALTHEQRQEHGIQSAISRGYVPWARAVNGTVSEKERSYDLSRLPQYQRGSKADNRLIAETLNEEYHNGAPVRDSNKVHSVLSRMRKKNKKEF